MAQRVYKIAEFSKSKASDGCLCAMLKIQDVTDHQLIGKTVKNIEDDGSPGLYYHGTGICKFNNGLYVLTINGISYTFDNNGIGNSSNAEGYMLLNCTVEKDLIFIGNTAKSRSSSTVTTTDEGTSIVEQYGEQKNIVVNGLNARDQFAIQALQFLVAKEKNPSSLYSKRYFSTASFWDPPSSTFCHNLASFLNLSLSVLTSKACSPLGYSSAYL